MSASDNPAPRPKGRAAPARTASPSWSTRLLRVFAWGVGLILAGVLAGSALVGIALAVAYPNLPKISGLADYRPKLPMRVFSADGVLLGEFGEERRDFMPIEKIPKIMQDAVLAIEDSRFYEHPGVDYKGVIRAGIANFRELRSQGGSTITMQVAKNFYLSTEKTFTRKIYEILLAMKIETLLTKDQILELYMNQIYLGQRAYGFASACETYFGKPLKDISIAEAAMLAGLPQAPSAYNPIANPQRAVRRQRIILDRMLEVGFITQQQHDTAMKQPMRYRPPKEVPVHAEFVAEAARQMIYAQYGDDTYTRGLNVFLTIDSADQSAAYHALRNGIMAYELRQVYRGPEAYITLPSDPQALDARVAEALADHPDNDNLLAAVVLQASPKQVVAMLQNGQTVTITGAGLKPATSGLAPKGNPKTHIKPGAVIRVMQDGPKDDWTITQVPEVEGAFVSLDPHTGAVRSLVGGFDFANGKFNHVTQAWRQPGSSFKPFIYSAALERGFTPATVINDAPLFFDATKTGSQPWEPKNYDGRFDGPMSMRRGLAKSKNMVSIRILQSIGPAYAQDWITRFGFPRDKHPAFLTMALGAGSVTPLQMAAAYAVFANGGLRVDPVLISRVTDARGHVLTEAKPQDPEHAIRVIDARNAFIMGSLLQEVARSGTAARAQAALKRPDIYGKTGTTNDSLDAWFAGYQPSLVAVAWMGYDTPRKLGDRETGGGLALPVWVEYMRQMLKGVPVEEPVVPEGVVNIGGEWYYEEYAPGSGIGSVGLDEPVTAPPSEEERNIILDLFRR